MEELRLNQYLSKAGVCSRREADRLIALGRVFVNGVPAKVGCKINGTEDIIADGKPVKAPEKCIVLALNKPRGVVCTTAEFDNETNVLQLINYPSRVFPIGRLDKDSTGLLLLTNNGELSNLISRGANHCEKEYRVVVDRPVSADFLEKMRCGVPILDTVTRPCIVRKTSSRGFSIILTQGLNRQIRRMCEALGYRVKALQRVRVVNITLSGIPEGKYRELSAKEVEKLVFGCKNDSKRLGASVSKFNNQAENN